MKTAKISLAKGGEYLIFTGVGPGNAVSAVLCTISNPPGHLDVALFGQADPAFTLSLSRCTHSFAAYVHVTYIHA